mmetsp:Transcript_42474/g.51525  ORF Transcript_42474/g.51525 Transcript_42474/m.51525 type:complete len:113 (-) Transcript_42474:514-852(-)
MPFRTVPQRIQGVVATIVLICLCITSQLLSVNTTREVQQPVTITELPLVVEDTESWHRRRQLQASHRLGIYLMGKHANLLSSSPPPPPPPSPAPPAVRHEIIKLGKKHHGKH